MKSVTSVDQGKLTKFTGKKSPGRRVAPLLLARLYGPARAKGMTCIETYSVRPGLSSPRPSTALTCGNCLGGREGVACMLPRSYVYGRRGRSYATFERACPELNYRDTAASKRGRPHKPPTRRRQPRSVVWAKSSSMLPAAWRVPKPAATSARACHLSRVEPASPTWCGSATGG